MSSIVNIDCDNIIDPIKAQLFDLFDEEEWGFVAEKCRMCLEFDDSFHCSACVNNGNFGHSSVPTENNTFSKEQIQFKHFVDLFNSLKMIMLTTLLKNNLL